MSIRRYSAQLLVATFILIALAVEGLPLVIVSLNRIESPRQFLRTVTTLGISTAVTLSLGMYLFTRVTRRLNAQLEASEKLYRELFACIQSPVVAFTDDLTITFCNQAWADLVGGEAAQLTGRKISDALPGWENTTLRTVYKVVITTGWHQQYSVNYQGREFDVWVWRAPGGLLLFSDDITTRRQMEAELAEARRHEAELLGIQRTVATVAHEINNPLASQRMLLQTIRDEFASGSDPGVAEMMQQALDQGQRIAGIVDALQQVTSPAYKTYVGQTQMLDLKRSQGRPGSAIT